MTTTAASAPLTALDRCDRCNAQAYVRATMSSGIELLLCAHHKRVHGDALKAAAAHWHDETDLLAPS